MNERTDTTEATGADRRSTGRITWSVPVRISGKNAGGHDFAETAHAEILSREGGLIVCAATLSSGEPVVVERPGKRAEARVVGLCGMRDGKYAYGVQFTNTSGTAFWGVEFPAQAQAGVGRTVLQCSQCSSQVTVDLSEIELMIFESTQALSHGCSRCLRETLWHAPLVLSEPGLVTGSAAYDLAPPAPAPKRTQNQRRYPRLAVRNTKACLKRPGFKDDVVEVLDLSRGGIRFRSFVDYQMDTRFEVAVPYTEGGANIFTQARLVRVQFRPTTKTQGEFALEYLKPM